MIRVPPRSEARRRARGPAPSRDAVRLDERLVREGLAETRARAQAAVLAGRVTVDGIVADKPGRRVTAGMRVGLTGRTNPYVGRGGLKLAHALAAFGIDVRGAVAIDLGASTGGFSDCLLQAGAARVFAVDVGRGQLAWTLRNDPRVTVMEGTNARGLSPNRFGGACDVVTADLSFISLRLVWDVIACLVRPGGDVIALVKPQFEAGRAQVRRGGVVRDPAVHRAVLEAALRGAADAGLRPAAIAPSPITGPAGNIEYLVHLRRPAAETEGTATASRATWPDVGRAVEDAHRA